MKLFAVLATALAAMPLALAQWDQFAPCTQQCYGDLIAKGASLGCPGGEDACLCGNHLFQEGVQDCVNQLCPSMDPSVQVTGEVDKVKSFCASIVGQPPGETAPTPEPTAENPPASTPSDGEQAPATTDTPAVTPTEGSPEATPTSPSPEETSGPEVTGTPSSDASPTTTKNKTNATNGSLSNSANKGNADSADDSDASLSTTAKIGIGAGVGGGALLLIIIAAIVLCRRKRSKPLGRQISNPLPGSGRYKHLTPPPRTYAFNEKNTSELEMTSRRYEDMLPRQQPRQMV